MIVTYGCLFDLRKLVGLSNFQLGKVSIFSLLMTCQLNLEVRDVFIYKYAVRFWLDN